MGYGRKGYRHLFAPRAGLLRHDNGQLLRSPADGPKAWPGRLAAGSLPIPSKASSVEAAIHADIVNRMTGSFNARRFIPFLMMHEFEALLFSDCAAFANGIGLPAVRPKLEAIRSGFASPEEINDSPITAPSKRVKELIPRYEKPFMGNLAILEIGLAPIRKECRHFNSWVSRLEGI